MIRIFLSFFAVLLIATPAEAERVENPYVIAANKVPTTRVQVPEEAPASEEKPKKEPETTESDSAIPLDELPTPEEAIKTDGANDAAQDNSDAAKEPVGTPPLVIRDLSKLPAPVRRMRELILEASHTGDIERLRSLVGLGETATTLSIGGLEGDPIAYLKEASGDDEGFEILAILIEVLEAGFVHVDEGTEDELFVWPYFFAWPLEKLKPEMKVELYRILTAGDVQDSENFGGYIFYRVGIKPDGQWSFFVAGD